MAERTSDPKVTEERAFSIKTSGFFAMRTPLLPFDEFVGWSKGLQAIQSLDDPVKLEEALASDRTKLRQYLRRVVARPEVREALFVASPSLDESLEAWERAPETERGQKVERALVRYFSRMSSRPTPFGLFAGCSVGAIDSYTHLNIGSLATYRRHTRPDMDYLTLVTAELNRDPAIRGAFLHRPNSSLYRAASHLRYVDSRFDGTERTHHLSQIEPTDYLMATLERAKDGARLDELSANLRQGDPSLTEEETSEYILELVDNQVLVSDLSMTVTGMEPIHELIRQLRSIPAGTPKMEVLVQVRDALTNLDQRGLGNASADYLAIAKNLEALGAKVDLPKLFQVDMDKPAPEAKLGGKVLAEIERAAKILHRLSPAGGTQSLQQFRESFVKRYETREVPLVEVLDEESGIGFDASSAPAAEASPLLANLDFPPGRAEPQTFGARDQILLNKLEWALLGGRQEIELTKDDLDRLETKDPLPMPDSFVVMATVLARSPEALQQNQFRVFVNGADSPGAKLLGRFCHGDAFLAECVRRYLREEEALRPEAVFAEIVHLPEGRIGNVLLRPALRDYEIPYLGRSGVAVDKQIPVSDLMVSVVGNRIRLRSRRLGREVIPRMSNAHNFSARSLGLYRFLCSLQLHGVASLGWRWGALEGAGFLPRVVTGRLILERARWRVPGTRLKALAEAKGARRFKEAQRLREELRLPRLFLVADFDNTLPVDLDNALSVETFIHLAKKRTELQIEESLNDELCAFGPEGRFTHELVIPFISGSRPATLPTARKSRSIEQRVRSFAPGSEWLYAKIYTGTATADQVLRDVLWPAVGPLISARTIDRWFFIRFGDPDWHVRLRCHGLPDRLRLDVQGALESALALPLKDGRVWRFELSTYEREVERYGGWDGVELAEAIFHVDSEAVVKIVEILSGDAGADARWRLALRGMDMFLADLGFDPARKLAIVKEARGAFGREFRVDGSFERQLGDKYRKERASIEKLLSPVDDESDELWPGLAILRERSVRIAPLVDRLKELERAGALTDPIAALVPSYLHMHANRLLRSAGRAQELVIYDFLTRTYESQIARARKSPSKPNA